MKIDTLDKMYIVGQLKERGIIVRVGELDDLRDTLVPFAKAQLQNRQQEGIPEKEQQYAQKMAEYFKIDL